MNANPASDISNEDLQREAYLVYLERGSIPGRDLENWLEARERLAKVHQKGAERVQRITAARLHFPPSAWVQRDSSGTHHPYSNNN